MNVLKSTTYGETSLLAGGGDTYVKGGKKTMVEMRRNPGKAVAISTDSQRLDEIRS
jgi:hypothetical protein